VVQDHRTARARPSTPGPGRRRLGAGRDDDRDVHQAPQPHDVQRGAAGTGRQRDQLGDRAHGRGLGPPAVGQGGPVQEKTFNEAIWKSVKGGGRLTTARLTHRTTDPPHDGPRHDPDPGGAGGAGSGSWLPRRPPAGWGCQADLMTASPSAAQRPLWARWRVLPMSPSAGGSTTIVRVVLGRDICRACSCAGRIHRQGGRARPRPGRQEQRHQLGAAAGGAPPEGGGGRSTTTS